ncbi:MAG TPA: LD-carboxypeptidase [Vicinamibacteria bacterium]|nr:LD-carboxypeptidase [Vicinamibacteria bacterium]
MCAPASGVEPERLQAGAEALRGLGFQVRITEGATARSGFTAGPAELRLRELQDLFADRDVAGIVCARGGAGSGWLLGALDPALLRANHKVFVGFSDVTLVHLYLGHLRLVSLHGPMVAHDLDSGAYHRASFLWALTGQGSPYATEEGELETLRAGRAEGRLRGGCLSLLAAAAGTPWALEPHDDTILFLEDVKERPYRIDRMLWQLRHAGGLQGVRGMVFGDMMGCAPRLGEDVSLEDVIRGALDGLDVPIALGLSSGHTRSPNVTLPFGVRARLDCGADGARYEVLEAPVS